MSTPSAVSRFITARAQWLAWLCAAGALAAPVSRWLPADQMPLLQWLVELAAHWQWLYAAVGGLALGTLAMLRRAWWLGVPALLLAGSFMWQSATLQRASAPAAEAPAVNVLAIGTANLNLATTDFNRWRNGWRRPMHPMW